MFLPFRLLRPKPQHNCYLRPSLPLFSLPISVMCVCVHIQRRTPTAPFCNSLPYFLETGVDGSFLNGHIYQDRTLHRSWKAMEGVGGGVLLGMGGNGSLQPVALTILSVGESPGGLSFGFDCLLPTHLEKPRTRQR